MIDKYFPLITMVIAKDDKEWITNEIKYLIRERQKAHHSKKYNTRDNLAKKIRKEIKKAKIKYNTSKLETFASTNAKEWYSHIRRIINNGKGRDLVLNNVPELAQKSMEEIVSTVNNHFAKICQTYPPIKRDETAHETPDRSNSNLKPITEIESYKLLVKFSKKSLGPGDFPKRLLQEFAVELALPYCDITNCALETGVFPDAYKITEIVPIPKVNPPRAITDFRPISLLSIGSKMLEVPMLSGLEQDIAQTLKDLTQYGNSKGCSTTHYLISALNEAFKSTDRGDAAAAIAVDYSKAFDLVDHTILINKMKELLTSESITDIFTSYLSSRKHYTRINGTKSETASVTCGVPQGSLSGPRLFNILTNGVKTSKVSNYKFVDDKTLVHTFSGDPTQFLQEVLDIEATETEKDKMVINESKCNIITFNFSKRNIEPKELVLHGNIIKAAEKITLLGVIITNDLKWKENTAKICEKVAKSFHWLVKLKGFGIPPEGLITAWKVLIRPITEYAAPLWHSGLSVDDSKKLEKLQEKIIGLAYGIIYKDFKKLLNINGTAMNYDQAVVELGLPKLAERRESLTINFGMKTFKNEKHKGFFEEKIQVAPNTRSKPKIQEHTWKTERTSNSAIPFMAKKMNEIFEKSE